MGCANSKQNQRCRHCNNAYSPVPRSYSMHVHHPPQREGDSYHVVALTSTTLGSLKLDSPVSNDQVPQKIFQNGGTGNGFTFSNGKVSNSDSFRIQQQEKSELESEKSGKDFSTELIEAKTWSNMIEHKLPKTIPKTPIRTPPGEPETINTWELMEGLEDTSPFRSPNHFKSFSFDGTKSSFIENSNGTSTSLKPIWLEMTKEEESKSNLEPALAISDFDHEVISSFRKGFIFEEKKINGGNAVMDFESLSSPFGKKEKMVLYFTSLRGVRKTYEDCCHVRLILKGLGIRVDERDVSMHSGFKEELKELLGNGFGKGSLPRVFVGRNYIGGAEEIQKLHEDGKLEILLDRCEKVDDDSGRGNDSGSVCEACGDIRFVPCETCFGSCKIYYEGNEEGEDDGDGEVGEYGFQRCPDCNENGLIRCPMCCY